jgi:hypothetical protein
VKTVIGLLIFVLLFLCMGLLINHANAASFQASINISTPTALYHGHNCSVTHFRVIPADATVSYVTATCGYTTSGAPVAGAASDGRVGFAYVTQTDIGLNRTDCRLVDAEFDYPVNTIEIECGWTYGMFHSGFEQ